MGRHRTLKLRKKRSICWSQKAACSGAEALFCVISWVRIPKNILMDQGIAFMARTLPNFIHYCSKVWSHSEKFTFFISSLRYCINTSILPKAPPPSWIGMMGTFLYHLVKLLPKQISGVELRWLCWPILTAMFLNWFCINWNVALGYWL